MWSKCLNIYHYDFKRLVLQIHAIKGDLWDRENDRATLTIRVTDTSVA
jgi:hypothetical protein